MSQSELFALNTAVTLTAFGKNRDAGIKAAEAAVYAVNSASAPELQTSTVYAMNHANGERVVVSGQVADMLSTAKLLFQRTDGAYDPSVYPVLKLWGFSDSRYYQPSDEEISLEMSKYCFDFLTLTEYSMSGSYAVQMPSYGMITLASAARGCASKYAIDAMRQAGVESGIVSMVGNVQTLGLQPDGSQWKVAIPDPNNTSNYLGVIYMGECAMSTTTNKTASFSGKSGKVYGHIFNPKTGYPANNSLVQISVLCDDGTMADALSTALFAMGSNKALNYWRTYGGFDMIIIDNENRITCTSGLIEQVTVSDDSYTLRFTE